MSAGAPTRFNIQLGGELTWNVEPLLHEIRHALQELAATGNTGIIDLRSIPLAPGEEDKIVATLGQGEVQARIDALGPSEVTETRYAGVWLVTHYNHDEDIIGRFIEITAMPEILRSQAEDIRQACIRLGDHLQPTGHGSINSEESQS
jgi:hydrogenase-1 operon protein HyaF